MSTLQYTGRIRIKSVPRGGAPEYIRRRWVGLELPCVPVMTYQEKSTNAITRKDETNATFMVHVPQDVALDLLDKHHAGAADWWRQSGFPVPDEHFSFREEEVEILSDVQRQTLMVADDMETGVMELPGR